MSARMSEAPPRFASEERRGYTAEEVETARMVLAAEAAGPITAAAAPVAIANAPVEAKGHDAASAAVREDTLWDDEQETTEQEARIEPVEAKASAKGAELVPVSASVFDDDFFRRDMLRNMAPATGEAAVAARPEPIARLDSYELDGPEMEEAESRDAGRFSGARDSEARAFGYATAGAASESRETVREYGVREPALFAGASNSHAEQAATDELDIPAFLRRSR